SRPINGARPGSTPSSPSYIGSATKSTTWSSTTFSGVTTVHCSVRALGSIGSLPPFLRHLLRLFCRLLDAADVHERLLGQMVPFAVAQLLEAADRVLHRRHLAGPVREGLGHQERLRQKPLDAPRPVHHLLVFLAQLLDAKDGDDVLQLAVALHDLPAPLAH